VRAADSTGGATRRGGWRRSARKRIACRARATRFHADRLHPHVGRLRRPTRRIG